MWQLHRDWYHPTIVVSMILTIPPLSYRRLISIYVVMAASMSQTWGDRKDYCNSIAEPLDFLNNSMSACVNCTDAGCKYCWTSEGSFCTIADDFEGRCDEYYDPEGTMYSYTGQGVCDGFENDGYGNTVSIIMFALVLPCGLFLCTLGIVAYLEYRDKILAFFCMMSKCICCSRDSKPSPGFNVDLLAMDSMGNDMEKCVGAGYTVSDLKRVGYSAKEIREKCPQFKFDDFLLAEYTMQELRAAGFT